MRNTTNFNLANKLGFGLNNELKKSSEEYSQLKSNTNFRPNQLEVHSQPPFNPFKTNDVSRNAASKTSTNFFGDKKLD